MFCLKLNTISHYLHRDLKFFFVETYKLVRQIKLNKKHPQHTCFFIFYSAEAGANIEPIIYQNWHYSNNNNSCEVGSKIDILSRSEFTDWISLRWYKSFG